MRLLKRMVFWVLCVSKASYGGIALSQHSWEGTLGGLAGMGGGTALSLGSRYLENAGSSVPAPTRAIEEGRGSIPQSQGRVSIQTSQERVPLVQRDSYFSSRTPTQIGFWSGFFVVFCSVVALEEPSLLGAEALVAAAATEDSLGGAQPDALGGTPAGGNLSQKWARLKNAGGVLFQIPALTPEQEESLQLSQEEKLAFYSEIGRMGSLAEGLMGEILLRKDLDSLTLEKGLREFSKRWKEKVSEGAISPEALSAMEKVGTLLFFDVILRSS